MRNIELVRISAGYLGSHPRSYVISELQELHRAELLKQTSSLTVIQSQSKWQWCLDDAQGRYLASVAIIDDGHRRGWIVAMAGRRLSASNLRPLIRRWRAFTHATVYDELRAWVHTHDKRAKRFAEAMGFTYDCTASGFSPLGYDMDLYLWRRRHEHDFRGRQSETSAARSA